MTFMNSLSVISHSLAVENDIDCPKQYDEKYFVHSGTSNYQFTPCGMLGRHGPTSKTCASHDEYQRHAIYVKVRAGGIQEWKVPHTAEYTISASGASGGKSSDGIRGQHGWTISGKFLLRSGHIIRMVAGQIGLSAGRGGSGGGGGGGATIVYVVSFISSSLHTTYFPLFSIAAPQALKYPATMRALSLLRHACTMCTYE